MVVPMALLALYAKNQKRQAREQMERLATTTFFSSVCPPLRDCGGPGCEVVCDRGVVWGRGGRRVVVGAVLRDHGGHGIVRDCGRRGGLQVSGTARRMDTENE